MNVLDFDNASGIKVASFTEIREALRNDFKRIFGSSINLSPSAPDGMLVDIFAFAYNALAQNLQGVVTNLNTSTASGIFLDYLAQIGIGGRRTGESDADLVKRIQTADRYGYATYNGMLTYLRANIGVNTGLQVNDSDNEVEGLKAHRFAVTVPEDCDLTNDEIAALIWECKPIGIKPQGTESGTVESYGHNYSVEFDRVSYVNVKLKIVVSEYTEETLPVNFESEIKKAVEDWAAAEYNAGKDVIIQRLYTPVYSVPGIKNIAIYYRMADNESWKSDSVITLNSAQRAKITAENIQVVKE